MTWRMRVTGKVQGVYFRVSTKEKARKLGLKGRVRNHKDGSVRIEAQGKESELKVFLEWVQQGPERAMVEKVKWDEVHDGGNYTGFEVER